MSSPSIRAWVLALALTLPPSAVACGYHGNVAMGMLNLGFPNALHVRTAVWQAQQDGVLEREALAAPQDEYAAKIAALFRYRSASARLQALREQLARGGEATMPAFSLVLIGPMLWTRFQPGADGLGMVVHADGPGANDIVIVTELAVVDALAKGALSVRVAIDRGLVRFYGVPANVEAVAGLFDRVSAIRTTPSPTTYAH